MQYKRNLQQTIKSCAGRKKIQSKTGITAYLPEKILSIYKYAARFSDTMQKVDFANIWPGVEHLGETAFITGLCCFAVPVVPITIDCAAHGEKQNSVKRSLHVSEACP